jgi:cell division cycle protein 37
VKQKIDEGQLEQNERYEALAKGVRGHLQNILDLQRRIAEELGSLEQEDTTKITSESYRFGFNSSHINKAKAGEKMKENTKPELLNPNFGLDTTSSGSGSQASFSRDTEGKARASKAAKEFAKIKTSNYQSSYSFLSSHPEILQESETTDY